MSASRWATSCLGLVAFVLPRFAAGQAPTLNTQPASAPGSMTSRLGRMPGSGAMVLGNEPGGDSMILGGGRPGPGYPRVQPATGMGRFAPPLGARGVAAPGRLAVASSPIYGPLALPSAAESEGPPDGLTLDAAIDRLVADNLELRSKFYEIPQAEADVLTASLRANPVLFADTQLVPYGKYSRDRPGGSTQFDVNISYPLDPSGKRLARTAVARRAKSVTEAQYQDAVRVQIDNLYTAYVDVLAARETVRLARASVEGLDRLLVVTETLKNRADATSVDVGRVRVQRYAAGVGLEDAREALRRAKWVLAGLLQVPADQADALEIRGSIAPPETSPPNLDRLIAIALESRPDLLAQRLNVDRARSTVRLAKAEGVADFYLLYQPYTFQNNTPIGTKSATSWALGLTAPVPLFDRNQGRIARARLGVQQEFVGLTALERRVIDEVIASERDYANTSAILKGVNRDLLPASKKMRDDSLELFTAGEVDANEFFDKQRTYNEDVRFYRDALVRHRRAMLRVNTAVSRRVLP